MENLIDRVKSITEEIANVDGFGGQAALALAAEASKSVVNQWLAGKIKSMDITYALAIEKRLGYNHIWLMTGKGERKINEGSTRLTGQQSTEREAEAPARLPKTESPVSADVLAGIGFITEDEARVLNFYRMATERGQMLIEAAANGAPKRQLTAVDRDQTKRRLAGKSESYSN